jgi:arginine exporter protein ArgO
LAQTKKTITTTTVTTMNMYVWIHTMFFFGTVANMYSRFTHLQHLEE